MSDTTRSAHHVWLPYTQMKTALPPLEVTATHGSRIVLSDGRELIDGISSWWTACHGYNHPALLTALQKQAERMPHVMLGGLIHEPAKELAARLAAITPGDLGRTFFSESGSVSVEVAMKVAAQAHWNRGDTKRTRFVSFLGGYHGDTLATMAVADPEEGMHKLYRGLLRDEHVVPLPKNDSDLIRFAEFLQEHDDVAAVLIEPLVQGAGGMRFFSKKILQGLRAACDDAGVFLIADEIFVGLGRLGAMTACEKAGVVPDVMTLSKALTGGVCPLAATVVREPLFEAFYSDHAEHALMHGPTYSGHALGCAVANASLALFESEPRLEQVRAMEAQLAEELEPLRGLRGIIDVRVHGAIGVVQLESIDDMAALKTAFIKRGVWVRPFRDIVYLTPAYTTPSEELSALTEAICEVVDDYRKR